MIYSCHYIVNRHKFSHHPKPLQFKDNIRMTKILDEQLESKKDTGLELKHHKKGIYSKFSLYSSHKLKNMMKKLLHTLFLVLLLRLLLIF